MNAFRATVGPAPRVCPAARALFAAILLGWLLPAAAEASKISLMGSNGVRAEFVGIKEATPQGLAAKMTEDGDLIAIPWERLDLEALREEHPEIFAAYERSRAGETVALNLGALDMAAPRRPAKAAEPERDPELGERGRFRGWRHVDIGGATFTYQAPATESVRGILVLAFGNFGRSFNNLVQHERGRGTWGEFQTKYGLALMSYHFEIQTHDPTVPHDFMFAEKGSGPNLFRAIESFAAQVERPELTELPIAIFGSDRVGSAFAYHLALWKPERVVAAVMTKGAFYQGDPGEEAAKVPMLFLWGQYSNKPELWGSEHDAKNVLARAAAMKPNWTGAEEFRAGGEHTPVSDYFAISYLKEMLDARLPEAPKPPDADEEEESEQDESDSEKLPMLPEFDRASGFVGCFDTLKAHRIEDPDAELGEDETFLPNESIARMWEKLVNGELEPPGLQR